jgi:hypothetical protein
MDSKISGTVVVVAMVAFGIVAATTTIAGTDDASAKKLCESKKWSHCKGDKEYYTKKGYHHCFK